MKRLPIFMRVVLLTLVVTAGLTSHAQQDAHFTNFVYNRVALNPAFAGADQIKLQNRQYWYVSMLHRQQWNKFQGTAQNTTEAKPNNRPPVSYNLNIAKAFGRKSIAHRNPLGFGLTVMQEYLGFEKHLTLRGSLAYHIEFTSDALWKKGNRHLFFGINAGIKQFGLNTTALDPYHTNDPLLQLDGSSTITPDMGAGISLMNNAFFIGIAATHLLETSIQYPTLVSGTASAKLSRGFNVMGGLYLPLKDEEDIPKFEVAPAFFVNYLPGVPMQVDMNVRLKSADNDAWYFGLGYRYNDAASALAGINLGRFGKEPREDRKIVLGYSFDFTTSGITPTPYNTGTHEILLVMDFNGEREYKTKYDGGRNSNSLRHR